MDLPFLSSRAAMPRTRSGALLVLVALTVTPLQGLAQARLEPHERERLRHELREQMREERHRNRDAGGPREESRRAPMHSGQAAVGPGREPRPVDVADWTAGPREPHRAPAEPRPRLSPEEREALRLQIRERRRAGD